MEDDWFRSREWAPDARDDFEKRLRRARPYKRAQYLRIKGLSLFEAGEVNGARDLWQRVLDSTEQLAGSEKAGALEHLADSFVGHASSAAEGYYRRLLHEYPSCNGTTHTQHIKLAELLLDRGSPSDLRAAAALLTQWAPETHLPFPDAHYRWQLAAIRLAEATGDRAAAREAARRALDLAARGPVFSRHKTVGVVNTDAKTIRRLRRLAR